MYLKRIELLGFKSFTNRTKLSFEPGISCIVGPNGSGKSNIADALRWVLGEQSARTIRGGKLEDVIFSGSKKRRALGLAEVSIFLDNSDGYLPLPFNEVCVTRRAVRCGASEYLINDSPCRLKDIRDLFVDTGIGVEGLSLINQGRINELITARPDERRTLVEEAAGIIKYRDRKREALRKLEETERHLERVGDIINELATRVDPLREQAEKAETYLKLKQEADRLEIGVSVKVLSEADDKITAIDAQLAEGEAALLSLESERLSLAAEAEQLRLTIAAMDEAVAAANSDYYRLHSERERAEGDRRLALTQREASAEKSGRFRRELEASEEAINAKQAEIADLTAHVARTEQELAELESAVARGEGGSEDLRAHAAALNANLDTLTAEAARLAAELAAAVSRGELKREQAERGAAAVSRLEEEQQQLEQELAQTRQAAADYSREETEIAADSKRQSTLLNEKEAAIRALNSATQELAAEEAEWRYRCHSAQTRLTMLEEMAAGYEGFFPGVKGLLAAKQSGRAPEGIIDVIAELMEVPEAYRVAVEAYLGANIQNIVCRDAPAARAAVAYLKQHQLGRATFLPLDIIKVREAPDFSAALRLKGVCGSASSLIDCAPEIRPAVDFLLNHVLLVENMEVVLAAAKAMKYRVSVVTLDGDMVNPGASISGGSRQNKAGEILGKKSRLEALRRELAELTAELERRERALAENRAAAAEMSATHEAAREALRGLSARLTTVRSGLEQCSYREGSVRQRLANMAAERLRLRGELNALEEEAAEAEEEALRLQEAERELQQRLAAAAIDLELAQQNLDSSREDMTAKRETLASTRQKLHGQRLSLDRLREDVENLRWEAEEKAADLTAAEQEDARFTQAIAAAEKRLRSLGLQLLEAEEKLNGVKHGAAAESARLLTLDKREKELLQEENKRRGEQHQLELRRERWQADFENESARLTEKFALDLAAAKALVGELPARTQMIQQLGQLKRDIALLGNINLAAIDEYREVSERYAFLTGQREDMRIARGRLDTVIREMDGIMTSRFRDTFHKLSEAFNLSFRRLFDGGAAALVLSEPDIILETGVEISVELPGKKVANYNLLSGGEKSLIGIALMFAMLSVRPTPFCVMDEVDAALDEANIDRFTAYLRDKADSSQFVMISHRQSTMEAANALWGVTMEEEGVSKVLSVRLADMRAS